MVVAGPQHMPIKYTEGGKGEWLELWGCLQILGSQNLLLEPVALASTSNLEVQILGPLPQNCWVWNSRLIFSGDGAPALDQGFSNCHVYINHSGVYENADSDLAGLGWHLRFCISVVLVRGPHVVVRLLTTPPWGLAYSLPGRKKEICTRKWCQFSKPVS